MAPKSKAFKMVYDYTQTEEHKAHVRALERFDNMTPEEKRQTFIRAGILNEDGELVQRFGGTAPNPPEPEDED